MSEHIQIEQHDRVTTITISRPEKKNAITQEMYARMAQAIQAYGSDDAARALVISGSGDMFTAGNDLKDFAVAGGDEVPSVQRFLMAIKDCPKPVIAAVNGDAIGVGLTMLLHCDLVYASERATLSAPFVALGLVPEAASSVLLPAAVGMPVANDIFMTGRKLTAKEAHDYGLVSRVFPHEDLLDEVNRIAAQVANSAPTALQKSKSLVRFQRDLVADQMEREGRLFSEQLQSADFAEAIAAMMEKRAPSFK